MGNLGQTYARDLSTTTRDAEIGSGVPRNLDELPRLRGFRLRGLEMTRLETFIGCCIPLAVGIVAFVLALILPGRHFPWSGWVYFSMSILVPLHRIWIRRREE